MSPFCSYCSCGKNYGPYSPGAYGAYDPRIVELVSDYYTHKTRQVDENRKVSIRLEGIETELSSLRHLLQHTEEGVDKCLGNIEKIESDRKKIINAFAEVMVEKLTPFSDDVREIRARLDQYSKLLNAFERILNNIEQRNKSNDIILGLRK
jgi:chromosome segregation ATPase